jgi:hypothetical protein
METARTGYVLTELTAELHRVPVRAGVREDVRDDVRDG